MTGSGFGEADGLTGGWARGLPVGTITFLLTDVEGSTRHWDADPAVADALSRQEEIIAACVARHGGARPVEQGEGDSSVLAFARASDAAMCAIDIQRALGDVRWPDGGELRVRMALHTGEAELRDDGNYRGAALSRCARLRSIAHGGQIVLSQATYEVIADRPPDAAGLCDLGAHRLRDLARPEHVWQLCHPDLVDEFPPVRSLDGVANNLPSQLTTFIGREAEVDLVQRLLGETRLLTLTGAGGCGKTRLALQVAAEVLDAFPDGLWWVDLAPVADPALVPSAVAAAVRVREVAAQALTETLVRQLAARRVLLVLDNCEHLVAVCATLAELLLRGCPAVWVLATSREPLGIDGETIWRVPSLVLPGAEATGIESLTQCEAIRLFIDRATRVRSNIRVTNENAPAVVEICRRLDGIPLAIELAAARTRMLTPAQIADGLGDRFHLLTAGTRRALPRQRTLEASVDWSHDLLGVDERTMFRRLAAFAGGFTLEAAEAVCAGEGIERQDVLDLLGQLVDRSLVQVETEGSSARYRLLETVRYYARAKLIDAGEAAVVQDRHLNHYEAVAADAARHLQGPHMLMWLDQIDVELDNLRAAMDWSLTSTDRDRGLRIPAWLHGYWVARSHLTEARRRLEAALAYSTSQDLEHCQALASLCFIAVLSGDMPLARRSGEKAVVLARQIDDPETLAGALLARATIFTRFIQPAQETRSLAHEALIAARAAGNQSLLAGALAASGFASWATGEPRRAREYLTEGLTLARQAGSPNLLLTVMPFLAWMEVLEGRFDDAAVLLDEASILSQELKDARLEANVLSDRALLDLYRGRYDEAQEELRLGLARTVEDRNPSGEADMRRVVCWFNYAQGDLEAAAAELDWVLGPQTATFPWDWAWYTALRAHVELARSRAGEGRHCARDALPQARMTNHAPSLVVALSADGACARLDGEPDRAEDRFHEALEVARRARLLPDACDVLEALAGAVADQQRFEEAARLFGAAQALRDMTGYARFPVRQAGHVSDVAHARQALGADRFATAWAEGAELSLHDAIAYAQRGRGRRKRPSHGWNSLTPTELQIVELVAQGLTNPQIGDRLFISKRTVQTHLSHVFTKLGVSTRAELAATATTRRAHG
jgi:predicted ATPase/class 3 adenylate cyclase/DNA-binding CsgD family transcriptional regulator